MNRNEIEDLLPAVFQRTLHDDGILSGLLTVMEGLHRPSEHVLEDIDAIFSAHRTPERFVAFLAHWVDLERVFSAKTDNNVQSQASCCPISTGLGRLRELIASAALLSRWRGTRKGLQAFLEIATGIDGFMLEEQVLTADGVPRPFHLRVRAPSACLRHRSLVERIIEEEKPAYLSYELSFDFPDPQASAGGVQVEH